MREYNGNQLLHIRNPHGGNEWTGAWSDGDTVNWTAQAKADLGHRDEDDGEFWISVGDFYANYRTCYVCKVFPASKWVQTTVTGTVRSLVVCVCVCVCPWAVFGCDGLTVLPVCCVCVCVCLS